MSRQLRLQGFNNVEDLLSFVDGVRALFVKALQDDFVKLKILHDILDGHIIGRVRHGFK